MVPFKENFVTDANGKKLAVMLPIKEYNRMIEALEDAEDVKAYDKVMSRKQEFIPLEQALKEIAATRKIQQ